MQTQTAYTVFEFVKGQRQAVALPDYVDDDAIDLPDKGRKVLEKRYLRRDADGSYLETPAGMFYRVARVVAEAERAFGGDDQAVDAVTRQFYDLISSLRFFPNSPTFTGAGTPLGQLAACFVLPIEDDLGKLSDGIFSTLRDAALIQQTGGGNGFSFSRLRPKGDSIGTSGGRATGPVGFLRVYDKAFGEVQQGGARRGANMAVLRVDHPDIEEFIECKAQEGDIPNFNISVALTDAFMYAVEADADFHLRNPRDSEVWKTVKARDLFAKIVHYAHHNGEPGVLFIDTANRSNPVPHLYELEATNPCSEQWLGPYENCCLGSVNLAAHATVAADGRPRVNWNLLRQTVITATHFLDNVVTANHYVSAVPQLAEAAHQVRRIGMGIMGLADLMMHMGIRYGSEEGQEFAGQVMEFVRFWTMHTSIQLARARGPFPAIRGSIYDCDDENDLRWQPPQPIFPYTRDWGRPELDWDLITTGIIDYGIRNGAQTTIAPTGTIATVCGCEGYGCEPVFALGYVRHFNDNGKDVELEYVSNAFLQSLHRLYGRADPIEVDQADLIRRVVREVVQTGSCQQMKDLPMSFRDTFVVSSDITAVEHVRMQAALQAFVDNSLSKTINLPEDATEGDVTAAFQLAWHLGCKGVTVYVTGSRQQVVLETKATQTAKIPQSGEPSPALPVLPEEPPISVPADKARRPPMLSGVTYRKDTPIGTAYLTINANGHGPIDPFEVFLTVGKAGSEVAAVSEALGRLMSLVLRLPSPVGRRERLAWIADELVGIGGGRPMGFGPNRVKSLPDGIAQVLVQHLARLAVHPSETELAQVEATPAADLPALPAVKTPGDICPECGEATLMQASGCVHCESCGYSVC